MPPAAKGHQTLSAYISSRFDEFSRSQKDVAQYVVDHLDEVAFHTAEELARRASTSSSTVVRFAQALGFEGFPELQEAARDEYRHHHRRFASPPATGRTTMFIRFWYGSVYETYFPPCDTWKYALAGLRKKSRTGIVSSSRALYSTPSWLGTVKSTVSAAWTATSRASSSAITSGSPV